MKKQYEKPLVAIEYYELTQAIAACSLKIGFTNNTCVLKDEDATPQMKNLAATGYFIDCGRQPSFGSTEDGICYHTNMNAAFNS